MDKNIRIDEIVTRLNAASDAYYGGQEEQMTNYEWDALFDELTALEKATGYVRPDSPTQVTSHSGNEMDGEGEKEAHEYPALSLAKTKKVEELQDWAGERDIWLSWKLAGSTVGARYAGEIGKPVAGLVNPNDDTDYAATGSVTGHHATRAGLAYKWADVSADTVLDHIEWSCAASTITPVAVFDPVQLEGTTVTRASLCNVSELERLGIGKYRKT